MTRIKITSGELTLTAELNGTPTARKIADALPMGGRATRWGDEIYFPIGIDADVASDAREEVEVGTLAFWPPGNAFCIFWGPTPASKGDEPRAASPVNVVGKITGDVKALASLSDGAKIRLSKA